MSKSRGNAIYLSDSPEDVAHKVKRAYTDPTRLRATDPGHIEGNVVFAYLEAFLGDKEELEGIKADYKAGKISDSAVKARLTEVLNNFLAPIQERRQELAAKPRLINEIIDAGVRRTREEGQLTLEKVREAMRMDYKDLLS
jgi:tryptophanyl-tRNA synthetase